MPFLLFARISTTLTSLLSLFTISFLTRQNLFYLRLLLEINLALLLRLPSCHHQIRHPVTFHLTPISVPTLSSIHPLSHYITLIHIRTIARYLMSIPIQICIRCPVRFPTNILLLLNFSLLLLFTNLLTFISIDNNVKTMITFDTQINISEAPIDMADCSKLVMSLTLATLTVLKWLILTSEHLSILSSPFHHFHHRHDLYRSRLHHNAYKIVIKLSDLLVSINISHQNPCSQSCHRHCHLRHNQVTSKIRILREACLRRQHYLPTPQVLEQIWLFFLFLYCFASLCKLQSF